MSGDHLKNLQNSLNSVIYLIIYEKSMVGQRMLSLVDMRLHQAYLEQQNKAFGGCSIILVGDFGQLPPVFDEPMYSQTT